MTESVYLLWPAAALALAYGVVWVMRPDSVIRSVIKTGSTALLAVAGLWNPVLAVALAFGAIGDFWLSRRDGFLLGLVSFALGHAVYLWLLGGHAEMPPVWAVPMVLVVFSGVLWGLWPVLGQMRLPVGMYAVMASALLGVAFGLPEEGQMVTLGVISFVASDVLLGVTLFALPEDHRAQAILSRLLWALYWGGQAMILIGAKTLL